MTGWAFSYRGRDAAVPSEMAATITWIRRSTPRASALKEAGTLARILARFAAKTDGRPAASSVAAWRRSILFGVLTYAVNEGALPSNPLLFGPGMRDRLERDVRPTTD